MATTVVDEVKEILLGEVPDIYDVIVERICIGLGYTGVKLCGGSRCVPQPFSEMNLDCCRILEGAGTLAGKPATDFLSMTGSWDLGERVISIATVNAVSQIVFEDHPDRYAVEEKNLVDLIEVGPED